MRSVVLTLLLLLVQTATASANVRAPGAEESGFALPKADPQAVANITVTHETLTITAGEQVEKTWSVKPAHIVAEYTFENAGEAFDLPLVFLATNITQPAVTMNGKTVPVPELAEMNEAQQAELAAIRSKHIKSPEFGRDRDRQGAVSSFTVPVTAGKNVMRFEYDQRLFFDEGNTRYGAPVYENSGFRIDYLLYPAFTWKLADSFALDVVVSLPDIRKEGWFWDSYFDPDPTFSAPMKPAYDKKARTTTWTGSFDKFPGEIFTVSFRRGKKR